MYYITENYRETRAANLMEALAEFCFPSNTYCLCCGKIIDRKAVYSICDYCREKIQWGNIVIDVSSIAKASGGEVEIDSIRAAAYYGLFTRPIVEQFKTEGKTHIARQMAEIMWERIAVDSDAHCIMDSDIVVPAPTGRGEKERGFNQSKKLAKYIGKDMGIIMLDCLKKDENAGTQKAAGSVARFVGLRGAIRIKEQDGELFCAKECDGTAEHLNVNICDRKVDEHTDINNLEQRRTFDKRLFGKKVLLIDDVCTTGATLNECAAVLKEAGASEVHALVFATANYYSYGYFNVEIPREIV